MRCIGGVWCGWDVNEWGEAFYKNAKARIKVNGETGGSFGIQGGEVRQGCMMSPWLFNLYMNGVIRKMKAKVGDVGVEY